MKFMPHSFSHSLEQCCSSRKDDVLKEVFSNVCIAFHHRIESIFVNSFKFELSSVWLKQNLWAHESFVSHNYCSSIWKIIVLLVRSVILRFLQFLIKIFVDNITKLFLDVSNNFKLSWSCEVVTSILE